ncbi:MAG: thioredoxin domain-containing protein [Deltaproteobacteria bacterium]|nr:thioredoxin domain-containing protein [Deltaproteobacteria bacterium]MBW2396255.1 thioredoxin domain-containing protein [Deltaproteobacteria bacterium]
MSGPDSNAPPRTNRLGNETSAYLRQHMHNPVDWWPWCDEALALARREDKPLLVSIGYSACHWCHVMERESFEDPATAERMNEAFVPIKVDREERPDIDQIYMDTIMRLQGQGGWPLTVFCKPDGEPFYAGTYFPPEPRHGLPSFRQLLESMALAWAEKRDQIDGAAERILTALRERPQGVALETPGAAQLVRAARDMLRAGDDEHGGFGDAPKFPTPTSLELILAAEARLGEDATGARDFLRLTCAEMAHRGLYDQLGGGFHRYCVDAHWGVPHFEKMLYDQGQLVRVYADLWRRTGCSDDALIWPILETADWLEREMRAEDGGWFASLDADSEGVEGKFYVWRPEEIRAALPADRAEAFCRQYAVTEAGNFEGQSVLWDTRRGARAELAEERDLLLRIRAGRIRPATDPKRVTAWNALTASGLAYAGSVLGETRLVDAAAETVDFLLTRTRDADGRLLRIFAEGIAKVPAFLDDSAALLAACLDLYRAGAGDRFLAAGLAEAEEIVARFFDADEGDLFLTPSDGEPLPHRPRSDPDGATPHSTGLAVLGLLRAASLSGRASLRTTAEQILRSHAFALEKAPTAFPTLLRAASWAEQEFSCAVIVGAADDPRTAALAFAARRSLEPDESVVLVTGADVPGLDTTWAHDRIALDGQPTVYVCRGLACSLPITEPADLVSAELTKPR